MKLKNIFQLMGLKGTPKYYPYEVVQYEIKNVGTVKYAQWKHPAESKKNITSDLVDKYGEYIHEGDFCIDIGAHTGDTALPMALACGESGCVLALEPNPFVYPVLEKTARLNSNVAQIKTMMAAAGLKEGFMEFEYSDSGFCNGGRHENISPLKHGHAFNQTVFAVNLEDELRSDYASFLPKLSFLKVDTEGYDLYVIKSMEKIIREYRPVIKAEVFKKTDREYREELLTFFSMADYTVYKIKTEPFEKGEKLIKGNFDVGSHYDILAIPNRNDCAELKKRD